MRTNTLLKVKVEDNVNIIAIIEKSKAYKDFGKNGLILNYYLQIESTGTMHFVIGNPYGQPNGIEPPFTREEIKADILDLYDCGYFDFVINDTLETYDHLEEWNCERIDKKLGRR